MSKLAALLDRLSVSVSPSYFPSLYEEIQAKEPALDPTDEGWLRSLNARFALFSEETLAAVLAGARAICEHPDLSAYTALLTAALTDERYRNTERTSLRPPRGEGLAFAMAPLYPLLAALPACVAEMQRLGLPAEVIAANLTEFEISLCESREHTGRACLEWGFFGWLRSYLDVKILHVGCLNFERVPLKNPLRVLRRREGGALVLLPENVKMHRSGLCLGSAGCEEEAGSFLAEFKEDGQAYYGHPCDARGVVAKPLSRYDKRDYACVLQPGDPILSVHIPGKTNLKGDAPRAAYAETLRLLAACFPNEHPRAFVCFSWLMNKDIAPLCGGAANIENFQAPYLPFPIKSDGREVFTYVFPAPFERYEDLPENTRMARAFKRHYLAGNVLHGFGGMFLI